MAATAAQIRAGEIRRRNSASVTRVEAGEVRRRRAAAAGARKRAAVAKRSLAPGGAPAPAVPKPPPLPYAEYPLWARRQLMALDADQKHHQDYVGNTVIPGISGGLGNLQGYIDTAQNQYTAQLQGAAQGAYNVAAGATPMSVSGGPGGIVASPNAYQAQASSELSRSLGSAATAIGQHQAMLGKIGPATMSQGVLSNLAEYAKGLPLVYSQRRQERTAKIDEFMAEMAQAQAELMEKQRANKVDEAIRATNAESNAAIAFGRLGLDTEEFAADRADAQAQAGAPAPYGYFRDVDGNLVRDPSVPTASSSDGTAPATDKQYGPNQLRKEGFKPLNAKAGPKWRKLAVRATDGSLWIKKGSGSGGSSGPKPKAGSNAFDVQKDLQYSLDNSYIDDADQSRGTPQLLRFLRKHQPESPKAFDKWWREILPVLGEANPEFAEWMAGYMLRRKRDKTWRGRF
jgi:hypothetical protein